MQFFGPLAAFASLTTVALAADPVFILQVNFPLTPGLKDQIGDFFTPAVSYYQGSLYIGQVSLATQSEPFEAAYYATTGSDTGSIIFLSYHASPTGFQELYLFPDENKPVCLTVPHGGLVAPKGAEIVGFGWNSDGYLTYKGENKFMGCENRIPNSYQVYWLGNTSDITEPQGLKCVGPLYLYRSNITVASDVTL